MKNIQLFATKLDLSAGAVVIPENTNGDAQIVINSLEFNVLSTITVNVEYSIDGTNYTTLYTGLNTTEKRKTGVLWRKVRFTKTGGSTSEIAVNYGQGFGANLNTPDSSATGDAESNPSTTRVGSLNYSYNGSTWDRIRSGISSVGSSIVGWLNVVPGVKYNATLPTGTDGQVGPVQGDQNFRIWGREGYAPYAENNPLRVIQTLLLPTAATDGSWTDFKNLGANATLNVKSTAGNIKSVYCHSRDAAVSYLQLFKTATVPAGGAVPDFSFLIGIGGTVEKAEFFGANGIYSTLGWAFAFSSTEHTYTAGTAANHSTWIMYK